MKLPTWTSKIKRFQIKSRWYWYRTDDGGFSWHRISTRDAMAIIDSMHGVAINSKG